MRDSGSHPEFDDGVSDRSDLYQGHTRVPELPLPDDYEQYEPSEGDLDVVAPHARELEDEVQEATSKKLALRVPIGPTEEEKREHMISHIPYRSWCADCVRGKGLAEAHRKQRLGQDAKEQRRPLIALDYFYLGKDEEQSLPILAMVEEQTGRTYAVCMPEKGVQHQYNVAAVSKLLKVSGCLGGVLKSDNERSLVALRNELQRLFPSLSCEDATKGESQSNGLIESYIGKIEAQARTMKSALERHYGPIHPRHSVLTWLVDYAAALLSRHNRGADGLTPFERSTGKPWRVRTPEFGECVWYQPLKGERSGSKLDPKFDEGIFLGIQEGSAMKWIGTGTGVHRCWTIKCKFGGDRWDGSLLKHMIGLPWQLRPKKDMGEKSLPKEIEVDLPALDLEAAEATQEKEVKRKKSYKPRGIYIRRDIELEEYGYTPGCDGCEAAKLGLSHKQHSSACKQRIREAMLQTEEGRDKVERMERRAERFNGEVQGAAG